MVCDPRKNALLKEGNKSDRIDARKLADLLRMDNIKPVYHGETWPANVEGTVPQLSDDQQGSRPGNESTQGTVSELGHSLCRDASLRTAPPFGMVEQDHGSRRAPAGRALLPTTRRAAALRQQARKELLAESRKHSATKLLRQIPCIGPIRAALLVALMQTPHRFRTKRQLWTYSGLAVGDARQRAIPLRGRTAATFQETQSHFVGSIQNHNHDLKDIFKGAATMASSRGGTVPRFLRRLCWLRE